MDIAEPSTTIIARVPRRLTVICVLMLIGIAASVYNSEIYYRLHSATGAFKSFCNISQAVNCDAVAASPYSQLLPGFPLSSFAGGWFLAMLLTTLIGRNPFWRREVVRIGFVQSIFATFMSVAYFGVMAAKLKTYCLMCLTTDVVSIGALILFWTLKPESLKTFKPDWPKWRILAGFTAASLLVTVIALKGLDASGDAGAQNLTDSDISQLADGVLNTPVVPVNADSSLSTLGDKNAPIVIAEFSDFMCPFCKRTALILNSVVNRYPGKVRIVFRNFPLDPACNRIMKEGGGHMGSCEAARVALCANKLGQFEKVYEEQFLKQETLGPGKPIELAKTLGLDSSQLSTCFNSPETDSVLGRDIEEGIQLGIQSTPTMFVNGHKAEGALPLEVWVKVIDRILAGKQ